MAQVSNKITNITISLLLLETCLITLWSIIVSKTVCKAKLLKPISLKLFAIWLYNQGDDFNFMLLVVVRDQMTALCITKCIFNEYHNSYAFGLGFVIFLWSHDDVIKWKHLPRYWPVVRGIHRSPVNGELPSQRPVAQNFGVFFDMFLEKTLE